jgi:hypothetical protein
MANYTTYANGAPIAPGVEVKTGGPGAPAIVFYTNTFDASLRNITTSDTADILNLPAGGLVQGFTYQILTADAGGGTIGLGEGASTGIYVAAGTAISATTQPTAGNGSATYPRSMGSSDKTVRMSVATATVTTLKLRVTAQVLMA